jgi:RluA family pseudouridine synthase
MKIVHEDASLLVLDKPAGQLTIPGRIPEQTPSLHEEAETTLGRKLWIVHRIDRETSGLVAFAKDAETHRLLSLQFEKRLVKKRYLALVAGRVDRPGSTNRPIRECGSGRSAVSGKGGKPALTEFSPLKNCEDAATLLAVHPAGGRRHQIRVHLYSLGFPIIGDPLYGTERPVGGGTRLMLHAAGLCLTGADGTRLALKSLPGPDWDAELARWTATGHDARPAPIDRHAPRR